MTTISRRPVAVSVTASAVLAVLLAGCAEAPEEATEPSPTASSASTEPARDTPDPEERQRMNEELIEAAWDDDVARARRLVQAGADVNYADETQQSAYLIAASEGYVDLLDLTIRNGGRRR